MRVKGIGVIGGMAMAEVYLVDDCILEITRETVDDVDKEYRRLLTAIEVCAGQIEKIMHAATERLGKDNGEIFDFQLLMLDDKEFLEPIRRYIVDDHFNCEYALDQVAKQYIDRLSKIDNPYLRERTADVADLARRINFALRGREMKTLSGISRESIVAAVDLTPSQTAGIDRNKVKGIILEKGGKSSHSVILARSMGIPCIIGIENLTESVSSGDVAIVNGDTGEVFISPTAGQIAAFNGYMENIIKEEKIFSRYVHCRSITQDGAEVKVLANITSEREALDLVQKGGEGAGLLRTEFMYMSGSTPPSEEVQYNVYSNIARALNGLPLIIRTLDAGGDKSIPYLDIPNEDNPFLGYRAIRYCLDNPEIFKTQVSAILRSGVNGNVEFMIPMIATIDEIKRARAIIEEVKKELSQKGIKYAKHMCLGMMMETPAAAFMAERFAKEVDFFSIGTNDLTQYLFAADRTNEKVAYLNSYFHPALLRLVRNICDSARRYGIAVDICGQAGEVPELVPLWIAMGVDNLSVSIPSIPRVRKIICETNKLKAVDVMERALNMDTAEEVKEYLSTQF